MDVQTDNQVLTDEELLYPETYLLLEHPRREGESAARGKLIEYLKDVLHYMYAVENWEVGNYGVEYEVSPGQTQIFAADVMVYKGIKFTEQEREDMIYYRINPPERPCPPVLFEIASPSVWAGNIGAGENDRPAFFGRVGAKEYFCYDPHTPICWDLPENVHLIGWRYDENGKPHQLQPEADGRLWSEVLERWLVPDGFKLRLYDVEGKRQPTWEEAVQEHNVARKAETEAFYTKIAAFSEETAAIRARTKLIRNEIKILRAKQRKYIWLSQKRKAPGKKIRGL